MSRNSTQCDPRWLNIKTLQGKCFSTFQWRMLSQWSFFTHWNDHFFAHFLLPVWPYIVSLQLIVEKFWLDDRNPELFEIFLTNQISTYFKCGFSMVVYVQGSKLAHFKKRVQIITTLTKWFPMSIQPFLTYL